MVVVCGHNMGDIFRRNALNLGLHVVQSPRGGRGRAGRRRVHVRSGVAPADERDAGQRYEPVPLTPKEDEIRRTGGIFAAGRRELRRSRRRRGSSGPDAEQARRMTSTEQIVWAHRVDKNAEVEPGATLRVYADLLPASDGTAPFAIHTFNQITGGRTIDPRQAAIANDHFVFTGKRPTTTSRPRSAASSRACTASRSRTTRRRATASSTSISPSRGWSCPGQFIPGADSHSRAYGAYGAGRDRRRLDDARLRLGHRLHLLHAAETARVTFGGELQPWVSGKDIVLELLRRWGAKQSQGMSVELVDADRQLPIAYRNTIANMMAEAEALNGIFAPDEITYAWYAAKGVGPLPYPRDATGRRCGVRDRRDARSARGHADDREAVQPGQRVSRPRRWRASASRSTRR